MGLVVVNTRSGLGAAMKLVRAKVTNFRSAEDTGEFKLDHVTCLVGKNEAGKSAVLTALATLRPHSATPMKLDKERDYPRRYLTQYAERHGAEQAIAITTWWELDDGDKAYIAERVGAGAVKSKEIRIERRYGEDPTWSFETDKVKAINHALKDRGFEEAQLAALRSANNYADLAGLLAKLPAATEPQKKLAEQLPKWGSIEGRVKTLLEQRLPYFMYFSNYDRMAGAVQIEHLLEIKGNATEWDKEKNRGVRLFSDFFDYAGAPLEEIRGINTYETFNARLKAASNNITDQILEYWEQNPDLAVQIEVDQGRAGDSPPLNTGTVARARIYNGLHRVDTPFSERSAGFVWFFSFLVKFTQVRSQGAPVVLLLDEPGLTLHGKAQGNLLRFFNEKLAPHHQIVYSTHSPFMVEADKLLSARIVEDEIEQKPNGRRVSNGTKVREDVLSRDEDTIFPLQGALGYDITQSLFVGKHTLLVEGASDILYLQALSDLLKKNSKEGLDSRWTICPTGGIGNIRAFVSLFGGNKLDVAVLADQAKSERQKIEDLRRSQILKAGRVLTIADFLGNTEADIEDLFSADVYADLLNEVYSLPASNKLTGAALMAADPNTDRIVKKAEAAFRVMPGTIPDFDHFAPSAWLLRNPVFLTTRMAGLANTLVVAETIFKTINKMLAAN
jgi:predicted ATPase